MILLLDLLSYYYYYVRTSIIVYVIICLKTNYVSVLLTSCYPSMFVYIRFLLDFERILIAHIVTGINSVSTFYIFFLL